MKPTDSGLSAILQPPKAVWLLSHKLKKRAERAERAGFRV